MLLLRPVRLGVARRHHPVSRVTIAAVLVVASTEWRTRAAEPLLPLDVLTGAAPAAEGRPGVRAGAGDACGSPAPRIRNVRNIHVCNGLTGLLVDLRRLHSGLLARSEGGAYALVGGGRGGETRRHAVLGGGRGGASDR